MQFEAYLALLKNGRHRVNLVANSTMVDAWRHFDSASLSNIIHTKNSRCWQWCWLSWAGLAIMGDVQIDLVESDQRSNFSTVIRSLGLPAKVHNQRIESLPSLAPDVVTARALAPVSRISKLIENQISPDTVCLF